LKFFQACDTDVTESIKNRIDTLVARIGKDSGEWEDKPRTQLGVTLYYRILQSMLVAEQIRLNQVSTPSHSLQVTSYHMIIVHVTLFHLIIVLFQSNVLFGVILSIICRRTSRRF
jgi:hypothetical protein